MVFHGLQVPLRLACPMSGSQPATLPMDHAVSAVVIGKKHVVKGVREDVTATRPGTSHRTPSFRTVISLMHARHGFSSHVRSDVAFVSIVCMMDRCSPGVSLLHPDNDIALGQSACDGRRTHVVNGSSEASTGCCSESDES